MLLRTLCGTHALCPPDAVLGHKLLEIPAEELFFFVIQTYITSLVYLALSKPVLHLALLSEKTERVRGGGRQVGSAVLVGLSALGAWLAWYSGKTTGTYLGLILVWSCPVILFLWILASDHILRLPRTASVLPIVLPTAFLWTLDTVALHRGTWVIQSNTKLGVQLWLNFDFEEALFFFLTNVLVTFGQIAFDKCYAIILAESLSHAAPETNGAPSILLTRALTWRSVVYAITGNTGMYDTSIIARLSLAQSILGKKSRSFSIASSVFEGALRIDLINLYAFCRVVDDIVDDSGAGENLPLAQNATGPISTHERIALIRTWLKHDAFPSADSLLPSDDRMIAFVDALPPAVRSAFDGLPRYPELRKPLLDMLLGFEMDCAFIPSIPCSRPTTPKPGAGDSGDSLPVSSTTSEPKSNAVAQTEEDLFRYASYVAGTVAEMCVLLAFRHCGIRSERQQPLPPKRVIDAAIDMGIALQLINIARDIEVDAALAPSDGGPRVYVPSTWRSDASNGMMTKEEILSHRIRLLNLAFSLYASARPAMSELPMEGGARRGMIVAVESYVQIGRELLRREKNSRSMDGRADEDRLEGKATRASVPRWKRVWVVWWTLFRN